MVGAEGVWCLKEAPKVQEPRLLPRGALPALALWCPSPSELRVLWSVPLRRRSMASGFSAGEEANCLRLVLSLDSSFSFVYLFLCFFFSFVSQVHRPYAKYCS